MAKKKSGNKKAAQRVTKTKVVARGSTPPAKKYGGPLNAT